MEVNRPGTRVRARKGYTLRSPAEIAAAGAPRGSEAGRKRRGRGRRVPTDVARALAAARKRGDIPLRARAYALDERPGGLVAMALAVEADARRLANLGGERPPRGAVYPRASPPPTATAGA